ncbi:MAG: hypothetical protein ABI901_10770 [Roseiflexaceae bacterium]
MEPAGIQPSPSFDMCGFDPNAIAYYETEGWRAYYDRNWLRAFGLMVHLSDSQFHIPFPRSFLAVYHIIRASVVFVPRDHDLNVVRQHLVRFYCIAADANRGAFDPHTVADLELRYWEIHRELAAMPDSNKDSLLERVAALHAALFGRTPAELWASAVSRVAAANAVDQITSRRSSDPAADWELVESSLRRAYQQVKSAIECR